MTAARVYLDHNATTPVRPQAAQAVARALAETGNVSSVHAEGRAARGAVEHARAAVAALVGADAESVTFTSGATEALNLGLTPGITTGAPGPAFRLYISATEHAAVLSGHRFPADDVEIVPVLASGLIDLAALEAALDRNPDSRPLLALQLANNETGVIQPVRAAAGLVHARGGLIIVDAVQAVARITVDATELNADMLVLSAHKIGGPPGIGALVRTSPDLHIAAPLVRGGGQERGLRGGTENVPAIAGFAAAAQIARAERESEARRLETLRARLEDGLRAISPAITIFGEEAPRLPNTVAFAHPGAVAETVLIRFDLAGIALSSGSACSSGRVKSSHVLDAMGVTPDIGRGMLRASLGWTTQNADIDRFLDAWREASARFCGAGKTLAA